MTDNQKDLIAIIAILVCVTVLMILSHHQGYKHAQQDHKNEIIEKVIYQMKQQEKINDTNNSK